jgi:AraC-like DNA-binding protein
LGLELLRRNGVCPIRGGFVVRQMRAATLTGFIEVARHVGLDPYELLRQFEISPNFLDDPENRHAAEPIVRLLEESAQRSGCDAFGVLMAECRSFAQLGPLCLLLERLPSVRSVVNALGEYRRHFNDILDIALEEDGETSVITVELLPEFGLPQITDFTLGRLYRNVSGASGGRWQPSSLHVTHEKPSAAAIYRRYFACDIEWDSSFNGFACPRSSLDLSNPLADETKARHASQLLDLVELGPEDAPVGDQARRAISLLLPGGRATMDHVATNLGLSASALRRRLDRENRMFANLLNEVRRELAQRYLANSAHSITEISDLIGYTSISSFTRWFTGEFGMPPISWRSAQLSITAMNGRHQTAH